MSLVRYDSNVFFLEDIYGLDLYERGDDYTLLVVLRGGETSFKIEFESEHEAYRVYDKICEELGVRDLFESEPDETEEMAAK